ncbi:hypothetical protein MRX96_024444 [Rhipicephalus microplus]
MAAAVISSVCFLSLLLRGTDADLTFPAGPTDHTMSSLILKSPSPFCNRLPSDSVTPSGFHYPRRLSKSFLILATAFHGTRTDQANARPEHGVRFWMAKEP